MIGQHLESRRRVPLLALALLAVGFALVGLAVARSDPRPALGSALPLAVGGCLLAAWRARPFAARLGPDAIEVADGRDFHAEPTRIPYASLRAVHADGWAEDPASFRKGRSTLSVRHDGGLLWLPPDLNVPSSAVYRFLAGRLPSEGGRDVGPVLQPYLERQEERAGPAAVRCYRAAGARARRPRPRRFRAACLGLVLAGAAWFAAGVAGWGAEWFAAGMAVAGCGLLFWLATLADGLNMARIPGWKQAALVVGPEGLALAQGPVQGEVCWDELIALRYVPRPRAFRVGNDAPLGGIQLRVRGATVTIADIYDCPLYVIHEQILRYAPDRLRPARPAAAAAEVAS